MTVQNAILPQFDWIDKLAYVLSNGTVNIGDDNLVSGVPHVYETIASACALVFVDCCEHCLVGSIIKVQSFLQFTRENINQELFGTSASDHVALNPNSG